MRKRKEGRKGAAAYTPNRTVNYKLIDWYFFGDMRDTFHVVAWLTALILL